MSPAGTPPRLVTPQRPSRYAAGAGFPLEDVETELLVDAALSEDRAREDVTTLATVLPTAKARAALVAREDGVVCGVPFALCAFLRMDPGVTIRVDAEDGAAVRRGDTILFLSGHARGLLAAERTALNFVQRLGGVATLTARYVAAVQGTRAVVLDTRKTTPGWRVLEKYAVRCGGGTNHRMDLASAVLVKDNHLNACGGDVALAVRRVREQAPPGVPVQVECDTLAQVEAAVAAGVDSVLLDNMDHGALRAAVSLVAGRCLTEASGGVSLDTVRAIAEAGVDRISVGALTHSARALNVALDFE